MEIVTCPKCGKTYQFSKEQLLKSKKIIFPCLGCRNPIVFEQDTNLEGNGIPPKSHKLWPKFFKKHVDITTINGEKLKKEIFHALDSLPPMSQVVYRALEIMADPDSGMEELADAIETDQSIVSNILRIANSAYYGIKMKVSSIHMACVMLGKHTLREVIIMAGVSNLMEKNLKGYGFASGELWMHSVASALGSKIIAGKKNSDKENDAYVAGLIHDVGKIILDQYILDRNAAFKELVMDKKQGYFEAEKSILGFEHAEIASEICLKWHFPENIAAAIRYHHQPSSSQGDELTYIVHLANFLARSCGFGCGRDDPMIQLEEGTIDILSLSQNDITAIKTGLIESMDHFDL